MRTFLIWGLATVVCAVILGALAWDNLTLFSTHESDQSFLPEIILAALGLVVGLVAGIFSERPIRAFWLLLAMAFTVAVLLTLSQLVFGGGKYAAVATILMGVVTAVIAVVFSLALAIGVFTGIALRRHR